MMRVLLIDPPFAIFSGLNTRYFPVGLAYVGGALRERGHEVMIYEVDRERKDVPNLNNAAEYASLEQYLTGINDASHPVWKRLATLAEDYHPDIIGITSMTMNFGSAVTTAAVCKRVLPQIKIVFGGAHATDWPELCMQSDDIDLCVSGEGEESVVDLVDAIAQGASGEQFGQIPGVSYRIDGKVALRDRNPFLANLDRYPSPDRALLLNRDRYTSEDLGVVMTSRGCPYACAFCSHSRKVRYRNLQNVLSEVRMVRDRYGTRQFAFKDDSFTVNRKRTIEFCNILIAERLGINWDCTTRVNLIDGELLDIMQEAGCNTIKVGIETGSERILKETNKGVTYEQVERAADLLNARGIFWSAYFMYGLPTETREDMQKTLAYMQKINPPYAGLGLYAPMPNTQLWKQGIELGLIEPQISIHHFFETNPKDYFLKDHRKRVVSVEYDEFMEVARHLMTEFNRHNTRWTNMVRRGWSRRKAYKRDPLLMVSDVRKAFKWILDSLGVTTRATPS